MGESVVQWLDARFWCMRFQAQQIAVGENVLGAWESSYCISLQSVFILLYNAISFVTIARFRAEILPSGGGRVRKEMCQILLGSQHKMHWKKHHLTTTLFVSQMIISINTTVDCSGEPNLAHSFLTPPPNKDNISALQLQGSIVKQKDYALQGYSIQYIFFPNDSRNIWFSKYSKLSVMALCKNYIV